MADFNKIKFSGLDTIGSGNVNFNSAIVPIVQGNANWKIFLKDLQNPTSKSTYTTVKTLSSGWQNAYSKVVANENFWTSTYTTVCANSADWAGGGTIQGTDTNELNLRANDEGLVTGNARGESSVDLQTSRSTNTQIAGGEFSVVGGGQDNQASGDHDTVGGGYDNAILDPMGFSNTIGGGSDNYIIGYASTIPGGVDNTVQSNYSFATGRKAHAKHHGATVFSDSQDSPFESLKSDSFNVRARNGFRLVDGNQASGKVLTSDSDGHGTWQSSTAGVTLYGTTESDTQQEIFINGGSNRMLIPVNTTWTFYALVAARATSGADISAGYKIEGVVKNDGGTASIVGTAVKTVFAEEDSNWDATIEIDNDALTFLVTGAPADSVNWSITVNTTEVS